MYANFIGQLVFYFLALSAGLAGTFQIFKKGRWFIIAIAYIAAGGFCGVGLFGPDFLDPYGEFLSTLSESAESYAGFLKQVGAGEVPEDVRQIGLAYMLQNPVEGMERMYKNSEDQATHTAGKRAIQEASRQHEMNIKVSTNFTKTDEFKKLAERDKLRALKPLLPLENLKIRGLGLDPVMIDRVRRSRENGSE
jgi:hypothetical protein